MSKADFDYNSIEVMRAEEEWQRAGAYSVRIEGMNRQHHIPLREEFDEHDGPGTKYIVLLDDGYPVATCRFFEAAEGKCASCCDTAYEGLEKLVMIGRVVVIPEYRDRGLGAKAMKEAEKWIRELGYENIGVDSRTNAIGFYEKLGYEIIDPEVVICGPFECICMKKSLKKEEGNMLKILTSECLYGGRVVRYDGGEVPETHPTYLKWKEEGRLIPICPEVFGGLPTPRPDSQRQGDRVVACTGPDVTEEYTKGAVEAVRLAKENEVAFCIMKQDSPSCGSKFIYDGTFTDTKIPGQGLAVEMLRDAGFKVFAEEDMEEAEAYLASLGE